MSHLPRCWLVATLVAPRFKQATLNRSKDPNKISKLTADYIPVRAKFLVYLRPSFHRTSSFVCIYAHVSESPEASGVLIHVLHRRLVGGKCPVSPLVLGSVATQESGGLSNLCLRRAEEKFSLVYQNGQPF